MPPLTPIGDIATASMTGQVGTSPITWETAADWDSAATETVGAVHDTGYGDLPGDATVTMGWPNEDETGQSALLSYYPGTEDSGDLVDAFGNWPNAVRHGPGTVAGGGVWGRDTQDYVGSNTDRFTISQPSDLPTGADSFTFVGWAYNEYINTDKCDVYGWGDGSTNNAHVLRTRDSSGGSTYDDWYHYFYSNDTSIQANSPGNDWVFVAVAYNGTDRWMYAKNPGGSLQSAQDNPGAVSVNATDVDFGDRGGGTMTRGNEPWDGRLGHHRYYSTRLTGTQIGNLADAGTSASLTTATKDLGGQGQPDFNSLVYTLNSGSVDLTAIGSPGTASEETQTVSLGGASSYTLSWSNSHQQFRVKMDLSTTHPADSPPTISSITLST